MIPKELKILWLIADDKEGLKWPHTRLRMYNVYKELESRLESAQVWFNYLATPVEDIVHVAKDFDVVVHSNQSAEDINLLTRLKEEGVGIMRDHCEGIFGMPYQNDCFNLSDMIVCSSESLKVQSDKHYPGKCQYIPDMFEREPSPGLRGLNLKEEPKKIVCMASGASAFIFHRMWAPKMEEAGFETLLITDQHEKYDGSIPWKASTWQRHYEDADIVACPQDHHQLPFKSSVKMAQAFGFGKPVLASPLDSYEKAINGAGFIINEVLDLLPALKMLSEPGMYAKACEDALKQSAWFTSENISIRWAKLAEHVKENKLQRGVDMGTFMQPMGGTMSLL